MLIGICGRAGSGKDTVADYLVQQYLFKKISLADPLKRLVKDVFALDDYTVYDRIAREKELEKWPKWSVRKLLQYIGTELFREHIDPEIWVKSLWYKIEKENGNYVTADIRFPNELDFFRNNAKDKFVCIKIIRPCCNGEVGLKGHASEAYDLKGDFEIINDGTIKDLYNKLELIVMRFASKKIDIKDLLKKILNESYEGHNDGCLHCAEINELVDHYVKEEK